MIKLDQAVKEAKDFLNRSGIYLTSLEEVSAKDKKWVVILKDIYGVVSPELRTRYIVELDGETGDIIGFRKERPRT